MRYCGKSCGRQGWHSRRPERNARILWVIFSEEDSERTAVIARCGMECSAAWRSGAKGNNVR